MNQPASPGIDGQSWLPELLAPAGNWDCAKAAIENGADAIYFGLERFNARMRADNFTEAELPQVMAFLHGRGVKGYVTLNTLIFTQELPGVEQFLRTIVQAGVDAVIVQDIGLCRLIRHLSPDLPIHASTQMTITSAAGVAFAQSLGCEVVVLARECSLKEIDKIQQQLADRGTTLPLEVFVHGALCVAYSGQCLTSEALGGRSANRGECAQACRMPYTLIADGEKVELGEATAGGWRARQYLLSPQDLAGLEVLPELLKTGVHSLKIEGRLKSPEYVAAVTRVYRGAIDQATGHHPSGLEHHFSSLGKQDDRYQLEMAFSRGLSSGWFRGINNQQLVQGWFGKKRGVYLGEVVAVDRAQRQVILHTSVPVKPGDGVVFDNGCSTDSPEEGGRVYGVARQPQGWRLTFGARDLNFKRIQPGDRVWKTSDPEFDRQVRQTFKTDQPQFRRAIDLEVQGREGQPLVAIVRDRQGHVVQVQSALPLVMAERQPLDEAKLRAQFGRLGNTPFYLEHLSNHLQGAVILPVKELNHLRRQFVAQLQQQRSQPKRWQLRSQASYRDLLPGRVEARSSPASATAPSPTPETVSPQLIVLVRNLAQLQAVLQAGVDIIYCEFEDPRRYREAVHQVRQHSIAHNKVVNSQKSEEVTPDLDPGLDPDLDLDLNPHLNPHLDPHLDKGIDKGNWKRSPEIWVAPPRITKPLENWILQQVKSCEADGYLIRNYDHLQFFAQSRCIGDFSLNVANPLTAAYFKQHHPLERLTASYDLNIQQLEALLQAVPPQWLEVTLHQHMPLFHMEHCVFCAFLSSGTDYTNCGRPCESREVKLRDRVGTEHILHADAGCRNTLYNGMAQTGAEYMQRLCHLGVRHFRIEFLQETPRQVQQILGLYRQLLRGEITGTQLWRSLKVQSQLGVTRGTLERSSG